MDNELDTQSQESIGKTVDTAKNVANKTQNTINKLKSKVKSVGNTGKTVAKTTGNSIKSFFTNPIVLKALLIAGLVLLGIILLAVLINTIIYAITATDYDGENGLLSSKYGIQGDKFYGARFLYRDDETANIEIQEDYLTFTYNILNDTKSETGLTITLSAEYTNDLRIIEIATNFANKLIDNNQSNLSLEKCISKTDHFGFSNDELNIVINSIASTLISNSSGTSWASNNSSAIKTALTTKCNSIEYQSYKNVTPKIYVWDYILENEDSSLEKLPKKDYIGFVFMPKENVTLTSASFFFVVEGGYGVDVCLYKQEQQNAVPFSTPQNANVTWFKDNHMQEIYECDFNEELQQFTAIDTNNVKALSTPTSIFTLLQDGTYSTYFNQMENYDDLTLLQNMADSKYIFLYTDNKDEDRSEFNFAEAMVSYK